MEIKKTNEMNRLFDFYGELLTPKQRTYIALYYAEDYSLGEIAEHFTVSRQAVYDNIRRTEKILENYETHLQMVRQYEQRLALGDQIKEYIEAHYPNDDTLNQLLTTFLAIDDEYFNEEV